MELQAPRWRHPGGKLREKGAESLTDAELLAQSIKASATSAKS